MPNMASITVKDDANADVTFIARSASPGDGAFASWSTNGPTPLQSATLRSKVTLNGKRDGRRVEFSGQFPYLETANGKTIVVAMEPFSVSVMIPLNQPVTTSVYNATVLGNLMASALIKEIMGSSYNAT